MSWKVPSLFPYIIFSSLLFLYLYSISLPQTPPKLIRISPSCDLFHGKWELSATPPPLLYNESCPFQRTAWNCLKNKRRNIDLINSYQWVPNDCDLRKIDPHKFLNVMRNRNLGFVGDSLNENFLVSLLCTLRAADWDARKWKRRGAWKGAYFPKYNVTVAYHRAVLLANYEWKGMDSGGFFRVDVDVPAKDWINISSFYDVLVFNTGHWWNYEKFPKETPLVFYKSGKPITPSLSLSQGLETVLQSTISYVETHFPKGSLKFWRLQSPRHFLGGEWNQNGSCLLEEPLGEQELDTWFDPANKGVNKEARVVNNVILKRVKGTSFEVLDLTHLSEFRADAHPAVWLGRQDAVRIWGQDCLHWCLPGVPDVWVDILGELIRVRLQENL